jgi:diguanylate cyclase (GGDEF)-like protein
MSSQDKTQAALVELGDPGARRTRSEQIQHALHTALLLTDADAAIALIPSNRRGERLVIYAGSAIPAIVPAQAPGSDVARCFAESGTPLLVPDLTEEARWVESDGCPGLQAGPAMFTPLRQREPAIGYLAVYRRRGRARFGMVERNAMLLLSSWLGITLESLRLASGAEKFAMTDGLTHVYNARFLKAALRREVRRAGRFGQELSLVQVGVDRAVAEVPDAPGGTLPRELAALLSQQVRSFDLLARCGNDEFMLVLPQTGRDGAVEVAERVRAAVEGHAFSIGPAGAVTVSCGVAVFPREGADEKALTASVERALGWARQQGPNRIGSPEQRAA